MLQETIKFVIKRVIRIFVATSTGKKDGLFNAHFGACYNRNMRLAVHVCCEASGMSIAEVFFIILFLFQFSFLLARYIGLLLYAGWCWKLLNIYIGLKSPTLCGLRIHNENWIFQNPLHDYYFRAVRKQKTCCQKLSGKTKQFRSLVCLMPTIRRNRRVHQMVHVRPPWNVSSMVDRTSPVTIGLLVLCQLGYGLWCFYFTRNHPATIRVPFGTLFMSHGFQHQQFGHGHCIQASCRQARYKIS